MDSTSTIILVAALFIIMTGMGLSLTVADFKRVLLFPKAVFIGFLSQIVLLPLIGYTLIVLFDANVNIAMGVMIMAACPGGPTSNLVTHLAKGDTALSVTLTAINSLITIITIPLIVNFALNEFVPDGAAISAPIGKIAGSLVVVIAIPLAIGMLLNKYATGLAAKMDKPVKIASTLVLVLVIVGLCIKEKESLMEYLADGWAMALALNVTTMIVGFVVAKIARLNFKQALTITIESGNQNGTLAIHVAVVSLGVPAFAVVAIVYSLLMYFTASIPVLIGNQKTA